MSKEYEILYSGNDYYVEILSVFPRKVKDAIELYYRTNHKIEHQITGNLDSELGVTWVHMTLMDMKRQSDLFLWTYKKSPSDGKDDILVQIPIEFYQRQVPSTSADLIAVMNQDGLNLSVVIVTFSGNIYLVSNLHEPNNMSLCHVISDLRSDEECCKVERKGVSSFIIATTKSRYFELYFSYQGVQCQELKSSSKFMNMFNWFKSNREQPFLNCKVVSFDNQDFVFGLTINSITGLCLESFGSCTSLFDMDILKSLEFGSGSVQEALLIDFDTSIKDNQLYIHVLVGLVFAEHDQQVQVHVLTYIMDRSYMLTYFEQKRLKYNFTSQDDDDMFVLLYDMKIIVTNGNQDLMIYCNDALLMVKNDSSTLLTPEIYRYPKARKFLGHDVTNGKVNLLSPIAGILEVKSSGRGVSYKYEKPSTKPSSSTMMMEKEEGEYFTLEKSFEIYREQNFIQNFDITSDINELVLSLIRNKIDLDTMKVKQKLKLFNDLYKFLNESGVWNHINDITKLEFYQSREQIESCYRIFELKLDIFSKPQELSTRRYNTNRFQDLLSRVSSIDEIFSQIVSQKLDTPTINSILLALLGGALSYRATYREDLYNLNSLPYDLWTWRRKVRDLVIQHIRTALHQITTSETSSFKVLNLYDLVDLFLLDYEDQLYFAHSEEQIKTYESLREEFINPFTESRDYHLHAKELAEKHNDYKSLIKVLDERVVMEKIKTDPDFKKAAFEYYYGSGKKYMFINLANLSYIQEDMLEFLKDDHELLFLVKTKMGQLDVAIQDLKRCVPREPVNEKEETLKAILSIAQHTSDLR